MGSSRNGEMVLQPWLGFADESILITEMLCIYSNHVPEGLV